MASTKSPSKIVSKMGRDRNFNDGEYRETKSDSKSLEQNSDKEILTYDIGTKELLDSLET